MDRRSSPVLSASPLRTRLAGGEVDYLGWFQRLVGWDIVLTAAVAIAPLVVMRLFPGNPDAVELFAVPLPIGALIVRLCSGRHQIQFNACDAEMKQKQMSAFMLALVMLVTFDVMMIMLHIVPPLAPLAAGDYALYGGLFLVYLGLMAYAMYPGRVKTNPWATFGREG